LLGWYWAMNDFVPTRISEPAWFPRTGWQWLLTVASVGFLIPTLILTYYILNPSNFGLRPSLAAWIALLFPSRLLAATAISAVLAVIGLWSRARLAKFIFACATVILAFLTIWPASVMWNLARNDNVPVSLLSHFVTLRRPKDPPVPIASVVYGKAPDGTDLLLDIWPATPAEDAALRPAFIKIHGGGWVSGSRSELPFWNVWLNELGYTVFDIEYRTPPPERWKDEVADVKCALQWVVANTDKYKIDPDRISLFGHSAGGNLAMLAAYSLKTNELPSTCGSPIVKIKSIVNLYGPANLSVFYHSTPSPDFVQNALREYVGGPPDQYPDRYKIISPTSYIGPETPPTITILGTSDRMVPTEQATALAHALTAAGVANDLYLLPGADHGFDQNSGSLAAQYTRARVRSFLAKNR